MTVQSRSSAFDSLFETRLHAFCSLFILAKCVKLKHSIVQTSLPSKWKRQSYALILHGFNGSEPGGFVVMSFLQQNHLGSAGRMPHILKGEKGAAAVFCTFAATVSHSPLDSAGRRPLILKGE